MKKLFQDIDQQEIITKALKAFFIRGMGYGFGFLFIWLVARQLGANVQGIFAIAFLFLSIGSMVSKLGFSTAIVKWIANETATETRTIIIRKALITVLVSSLIIGAIVFLSAPLIAYYYQKPDVIISIRMAAITIPIFSLIDVGSSVFRGTKDTTTFSTYFDLLKFVFPAVTFAVLFFIAKITSTELPITSYLIGYSGLLLILLIHLQLRFSLFAKTPLKDTFVGTKSMLMESYPMLMASSVVMIMGWSDVFILGFFVSEEEIGVYSTAVRIATLVSFVYTAVATITTPKIAEFYHQKKHNNLEKTVSFAAKMMLVCGIPIFLILFAFPEFFLNIFGEEYKKGHYVLRILLLAQFTNVLTGSVGPVFQMTGKQKILQNFLFVALLINIVLSFTLVNFYQSEGVAIGSAIGMMFWNIAGSTYLKRKENIRTWATF